MFILWIAGCAALSDMARGAGPVMPEPLRSFVGEGYGVAHPDAPPELAQFGQLVGLWHADAEMRRQDGGWVKSAPGTWAWKYVLGGFAVSDLFYQGVDELPAYMANLGRDYLLTANRIYDVRQKKWQVAWMANGAGEVPGADYGTFTAVWTDNQLVMSSPPADGAFGLQRVVFHDFSTDSFRWKSEYSTDEGKTWNTVMRIQATRIGVPGTDS
jgi:hypothetical protein